MMHGREKSDSAIVAVKPANKVERSAAEPVEPRAETKGNVGQQSTRRTQSRISVSKMLARIRQNVAVDTRGRSRMRESCMYGSVRGARGDSRPYRDLRKSDHIAFVGSAVVVFLCTNAVAQEGHYGLGHDKWHESFYSTLKRDDGGSCCDLMDCRPTQSRMIGDHYEVKGDGAWM